MKNIFLVDDDVYDRELFEEALLELNIPTSLTSLEDGTSLMKKLDETVLPPPHAIFLDLNMPGKNGFDCLADIRKSPKLKNIMVVIFSTSDSPQAIESTYLLGANYYICKPRSFQILKNAIETVLLIISGQVSGQVSRDNYFLTIN